MHWLVTGGLLWAALAVDVKDTSEKIRQLEIQIEQLQQQMLSTRSEYDRLQLQLRDSEENIGEVAQHLEVLHGALNDKQNTLTNLKNERQQQKTWLDQQRQSLAQQIRAAYLMGRQDYLKLLLNQEDPFTLGRLLAYYDYFNYARAQQIANINATLQRLAALEDSINQEEGKLKQLFDNEKQKQARLELTHQEREKILAQFASSLESQEKELNQLQENKRQLEALLGTLGEAFKNIPQPPGQSFAGLQGQLLAPIRGQILYSFGQPLVGNLKWQGILMAASSGTKVRAIAAGRVVFAQWFRNLGLLIILDHGESYMSLYAHNQSLYKKTGESVKAGEIIASVGNSGGRKQSALYFEIRQQGIPIDPMKWVHL